MLQWTDSVTLCTNGPAEFTPEQRAFLVSRKIALHEEMVHEIIHQDGQVTALLLENEIEIPANVIFSRHGQKQAAPFAEQLGLKMTDVDLVAADEDSITNKPGVFAVGDMASNYHQISGAVVMGARAAQFINRELTLEQFG